MRMTNDIKWTSVDYPCMRHVLLCGSTVYEGIPSPTNHSHWKLIAHEGIHVVVVILRICIRTNGSTPILILCFLDIWFQHLHSLFSFALCTCGILALGLWRNEAAVGIPDTFYSLPLCNSYFSVSLFGYSPWWTLI